MFCTACNDDVDVYQEEPSGYLVCTTCGSILEHSSWSTEPTFTKEGGESTVAGHFVSNNAGSHGFGRISNGRMYGFQYDSIEKANSRARLEVERLVDLLGIRPRDEVCNAAQRLYMLAVQHNFTKGRRTAQIAAAAIYIICRQENHPFMLLDFSDILQVNVFVLGSVFLQLCRLLRLEEHPIMTRQALCNIAYLTACRNVFKDKNYNTPVDPSLYLHRFADGMGFGKKMHVVANTALRLVSCMKRDWLQTGRRPAGICGAALYIAGHIHGFPISREDVIKIVHIGESTLDKRVSEFVSTEASEFTAVELEEHSKLLEKEEEELLLEYESYSGLVPATHGTSCPHVGKGTAMFAHGMCKDCFVHFLQVTGGMSHDGANPPAFGKSGKSNVPALGGGTHLLPSFPGEGDEDDYDGDDNLEDDMTAALGDDALQPLAKAIVPSQQLESFGSRKRRRVQGPVPLAPSEFEAGHSTTEADKNLAIVALPEDVSNVDNENVTTDEANNVEIEDPGEVLSDLSDSELDVYFHSEDEVRLKSIVWTAMNQDYIEKQALKAAALPKDDDVIKPEGGKRMRGRPKGSKSKPKPEDELQAAESAADGVRKLLDAKKLSSKINYDNLDSLFATDDLSATRSALVDSSDRINPAKDDTLDGAQRLSGISMFETAGNWPSSGRLGSTEISLDLFGDSVARKSR